MLLSLVLSLLPSFCLCLSLSLYLSLSLSQRHTHTCMHRYTCKHTEMHTENCDTEMHTQNCHTEMHTLRIATQMRTHRIANIKLVLIWVDGAVLQVIGWIVAEIFNTFVHLIMIQVTGLSVLFGTTLRYNYGNIFLKCSHGIFLFFDKVSLGFLFVTGGSHKPKIGLIVGIVGGLIGLLLFATVLCFLWKSSRRGYKREVYVDVAGLWSF